MEFGRALWMQASLQYAIEEAARRAMVSQTLGDSDLRTLVLSKAQDNVYAWQPPDGTFAASVGTESMVVDSITGATEDIRYIEISADYRFEFLIPILIVRSLPLSAIAKTYLPTFG